MAAMTMDREARPEVNGFMDMYKFNQNQMDRHRQFGGGASLPLNSDGLDEKRQRLKDERHVDWMKQQEKEINAPVYRNPYKHASVAAGPQKPGDYDLEIQRMTDRYHNKYNDVLFDADQEPPTYYRVGTPEVGLPGLGKYEEQRKQYDKMRQKDYSQYQAKQNKLEQERVEARRRISPPRQRPAAQMDYNQVQEQSRVQDKRAYQDYMGKYQHPVGSQAKPSIDYQQNRRMLAQERKEEYNRFIEEKQKQEREFALRGRAPTPPGGLDIGQYDRQVKKEAPQKKKEYKAMLDQQKDAQLKLRAWERIVDLSPGYVKVREDERPLVGSPRDINVHLQEKENKDKFRRDYKGNAGSNATSLTASPYHSSPGPYEDDPKLQKYLEFEHEKREEQRRYRDELMKQKQEHMYLRARQEPEVAVLERTGGRPPMQSPPNMASKPPPGPGHRPREDHGSRQTPAYWNEGRRSKGPHSYDSEGSRQYRLSDNISDVPLAFRTNVDERRGYHDHQGYGQPPFPGEGVRENGNGSPQRLERRPPPSPARSRHGQDDHSMRQTDRPGDIPMAFQTATSNPPHPNAPSPRPQWLEGEGHAGYKHGDQQHSPGQPRSEGGEAVAYDGDSWIKERRRIAGLERQQDYNDYAKQKMEQEKRKHEEIRRQAEMSKPKEVKKNAYYGSEEHEAYVQKQRKELGDEYMDYLNKQYEPGLGRVGLPLGQYRYEPKRLAMEAERNLEYNEHKKKFEPTASSQGLPLGQYRYEPKRLAMEAQRNADYNAMLQQPSPRQKPVDGPQGLNIDVEHDKKKKQWLTLQRNKEYNRFLSEENAVNTHSPGLYERSHDAAQAMRDVLPTVSGNAYLPPQTSGKWQNNQEAYPPRHQQMFDEPYRDDIQVGQNQHNKPGGYYGSSRTIKAVSAPPLKSSPTGPPLPTIHQAAHDTGRDQYRKRHEPGRRFGMRPNATATTLPVGQYDELRPQFEAERNREYNALKKELQKKASHSSKKAPTPPQGLPIGQHNYEPMYKSMEKQRNEEYNRFLAQKYGASSHRSTLSEPDRTNTSFYFGNDSEHDAKKKYLETQRHREYNSMLKKKEPPRSRSIEVPTDADSGLPIGQQHHETWQKFLRDQRNHEYNQMMDLKNQRNSPRKGWNYEQNGMLELRGDDANQSRQKELKAERQKEYNERMHQIKGPPPNRKWPEPEDRGALLVKKGVYDNVRQMYDDQRRKEFTESMNKRQENFKHAVGATTKRARSEPKAMAYENPMVQSMGQYEDVRKRLGDVRKEEFQKFMSKNTAEENPKRRFSENIMKRIEDANPFIRDMGKYENEIKKQMIQERRKEFKEFDKVQKERLTKRNTVKENLMPHEASAETPLVNYLGSYDEEKIKILKERYTDQHEYTEKRKQELRPPHRNFVYPTLAAAEKPVVDHMGIGIEQRKHDLDEERKREYDIYQSKQKAQEPPRRHEYVDQTAGPYNGGLFSNLGEHGNNRERLNEQLKQEYQERAHQTQRPTGRPNWVKDPLPNLVPNYDLMAKDPHGGKRPEAVVDQQYEAMLQDKRREESQRRRYDPEAGYAGGPEEGQYRQGY